MRFKTLDSAARMPFGDNDVCYLVYDAWNDWYKYETSFVVHYYDHHGAYSNLGQIKIGRLNMEGAMIDKWASAKEAGQDVSHIRRVTLPREFVALPEDYFSLGQSDRYYEFFGYNADRREVFKALRDVAYNLDIFESIKGTDVFLESLTRGISISRIRKRFTNLANGRNEPTAFAFSYEYPEVEGSERTRLDFQISPESYPPSNTKIIIGRNGVGKTHLLRNIAKTICEGSNILEEDENRDGCVIQTEGSIYGVIFASFNSYETFKIEVNGLNAKFECVGSIMYDPNAREVKKVDDLKSAFVSKLESCRTSPRRERWLQAIQILKSDPVLARLGAEELLDNAEDIFSESAGAFFSKLSTGHQMLFLIVTQLVDILDESYLVLIDEPECHLHPPLLASFQRCLSMLLKNRNAVAIIATHSPQMLQEVSSDSVWVLSRAGRQMRARNPRIETFGENTSILMTEVFDVEMEASGYHQILKSVVDEGLSYEEVLNRFKGRLGIEAKTMLRVLIAHRDA